MIDIQNFIIFIVVICLFIWLVPTVLNGVYTHKSLPDKKIEKFHFDPLFVGQDGVDCYKLYTDQCLNCANCGLCLKDNKLKCVPGDSKGPFWKDDCMGWIHTNEYDKYIFGEKVIRATPPWSMYYPSYETRYPSPKIASTLL